MYSFLRQARRAPWRRGHFVLGLTEQASTMGALQEGAAWRQPDPGSKPDTAPDLVCVALSWVCHLPALVF